VAAEGIENRLIEAFKDRAYFTRDELFDFFRLFEPDLKEGTLGWRVHDLMNKNIIRTLKRGCYVISDKPAYSPALSPDLLKIAKQITESFAEVKHCIWETSWLNEFAHHQTSRSALIIEMEKGFEASLFYTLKDAKYREVFITPDEKTIDFYIAESARPVIIKNLLTRAPLSKRTEKRLVFFTPALEKILVDLFAETRLFHYLQGSELIRIYAHAIAAYPVNFTTLFSYARRRERESEIRRFMKTHLLHLVNGIIDD
jgi:hypothetical protein